jgi:uncharacterized protein
MKIDMRRSGSLQKMLLTEWKHLDNEGRDLKIEWNIMHMYSSTQLAKLLAIKRGMNPELAALTAILHDIATVETMKKERHAEIAEPYIRKAVERFNNGPGTKVSVITEDEVNKIIKAVIEHSNKQKHSDDMLTELLKDVDSLDRYLHGIETDDAYLERCNKAMKELNMEMMV